MKHFLVTGGAGFIGSHLTERLLASGHRVTVIDDCSTGSARNVKHLLDNKKFRFIKDTIFNEKILNAAVKSCDIVVHLAAAVGVKLIVESPVKTIETNISGTETVLQHCAKYRKRFYLASTSEVYGKSKKVPFHENDDLVLGPTYKGRWSYACSKAIDEFLAIAYWHEKRVPTLIFRFFNTVGPRQTGRYGMVIPRFIDSALAGKDLEVYGDGLQSRCFGYVDDVLDGVVSLIETNQHYGQVFNVGNNEETSIMDLAKKIIGLTGSRSRIVHKTLSEVYGEWFEDMQRRIPDLSRIKNAVGYSPKYGLEQMLNKIIDFKQKNTKRA